MNLKINTSMKINTNEFNKDSQMKWEFLKYEIWKFTIDYSKKPAKIRKQEKTNLEQKLKNLENNLTSEENRKLYNHYENELETIYDRIVDGIRTRSKCEWNEHGEKSTKLFLNFEKKRGVQNKIRKLIVEEKEVVNYKEISKSIKTFYETLFKWNFSKTNVKKQRILNFLSTTTLTNEQYDLCENKISETDLFESMKSMKNNKTPGNDGLTKDDGSSSSLKKKKRKKKDQDKRYIKDWRPISLLNADTEILSKAISDKLKTALSTLISSQQTAYVKKRFIGESGRLFSDIIEISGWFNITGFLVTMDIEKAFDSLDHIFLISVLKKFGFGKKFITWIEILLKDQQSCVINGGTTTQYFNLERGARQGDPVSAYLFILVLEILFLNILK